MAVSFRTLQCAILLIWLVAHTGEGPNAIYFAPQALQFYGEYTEVLTVQLTNQQNFYIPGDIYYENLNCDDHVQLRPFPLNLFAENVFWQTHTLQDDYRT
jgi:hypothetical protein